MRLPRTRRRPSIYPSPPPIEHGTSLSEDRTSAPTSDNRSAVRAIGHQSTPVDDNTPWATLTTVLEGLYMGLNVLPPLKNAVNGLVDCAMHPQQVEQNRQEYNEIASDLAKVANQLQKHAHEFKSSHVPYSITNVACAIEEQIRHIQQRQNRSKPQCLASAASDEQDVLRCYRRVGLLFRQLQADISLGVWDIASALHMDSQLKNLAPAHDALYNAALPIEAMKRAGCTANTRVALLLKFKAWSRNEEDTNIYWMNGMAGTGKTTISYSLCEQLECDNQLGGSFFCSQNSPDCRDVNRIIPTIAYQLARYSNPYKSALCQVLSNRPDVAKKNLPVQFQKLIVGPLKRVKGAIPNDVVVVIDALDECPDINGTKQLLELLLRDTVDLPIKLFFTSRPDPCIVRKMTQSSRSCPTLHLHDIGQSLVQADIMTYLREALSSMQPAEDTIEQIALRAGPLFIFAATAVRYILPDEDGVDSHERLRSVLDTSRASGSKRYKELDALYTTILWKAFDEVSLEKREVDRRRLVLETIVCIKEPITLAALAELLEVDSVQQIRLVIQPLHSVIHMSATTGVLSVLHMSFPEFLLTPERAGPFYCDAGQRESYLATRCFELMTGSLRFNICELESSFLLDKDVPDLQARVNRAISSGLFYSCQYWANHLLGCAPSAQFMFLLDKFLRRELLLWMEVLSLKGRIDCGEGALSQALEWFPIDRGSSELRQSIEDARNFVIAFATSPAALSTPHIYVSVLPFTPRESQVWRNHWPRTRGLIDINATKTDRRRADQTCNPLSEMPAGVQPRYNTIHSIAFSPNGAYVVFGSSNYAICVWNTQNSVSLTAPLQGHTRAVFSLAFSPDGTRIVSGSADRSLRVWDAYTGTLVTESLNGHTAQITSVTFSPDGCRILSGSLDGTIRLWELHTGSLVVEPLKGHTGSVHSVAFSPDGMLIVSGSSDRSVRMWSPGVNTSPSWISDCHTSSVICVTFSPDGMQIASGSCDHTIVIWGSQDGTVLHGPLIGHTETISSVAFSPDGTRVASGSWDRTVRVWDIQSNALLFGPFEGHTSPVMSVFFSITGEWIMSGSNDGSIRLWGMVLNGGPQARVIDPPSEHTGWLSDSRGRHWICIPPDRHDNLFHPGSRTLSDVDRFMRDEGQRVAAICGGFADQLASRLCALHVVLAGRSAGLYLFFASQASPFFVFFFMALRPPSTSPSPSPGPGGHPNRQARASLGPGSSLTVGTNLGPNPRVGNPPISPRPSGMRPTSELITGSSMYQNPEAEAIDQWFENLQNYEATLEEMAAASLDVNFKEELSAIEQWFRVLSEAERTAALYSLLQHSTQVQIRFFITVLQQMARADPMTALLSPAVGASMQSQMEAKLASLGLKSPGLPSSPSARSFNRQSMVDTGNFLSPDSAAVPPSPGGAGSNDAAATLAQQRARLKATNAAHRISAPGTLAADAARANVWSATSLSQVAERGPSPTPDLLSPPPAGTRPKSTDFTGVAAQFRKGTENLDDQLSPMVSGNWASMVNTPVVPMFAGNGNGTAPTDSQGQNIDSAAHKLANWTMGGSNQGGPVVQLDDARKFRRTSNAKSTDTKDTQPRPQQPQQQPNSGFLSPQQAQGQWGQRTPNSGRFPDDPSGLAGNFNGLNMGGVSPGMGMNMGMMNGFGMMTPGMGMPGFGMNSVEGLQAQLLAAQLAQLNAGFPLGMMQSAPGPRSARSGAGASGRRSPKPPTAAKGEDEVDPTLLNDVPGWLRSLRLHKYTPNFEGMNWRDMVVMDEAALEAKGVAALGARRKMLKTFQLVREKMGIPEPEGSKPLED